MATASIETGWRAELSATDQAEADAWLADEEYAETMREVEAMQPVRIVGWSELRREIMSRGGIATGPYTRHWLPGQTYRVRGLAPDVMAADLADAGWGTWECTEDFLADLWKLFETYQAARVARTRRAGVALTDPATTETADDTTQHTALAELPALRERPRTAPLGAGHDDRSADVPLRRAHVRSPMVGRRRPGRPAPRSCRVGAADSRRGHRVITELEENMSTTPAFEQQRVTTDDGWAEVRPNGVVVVRVRAHVRRSSKRVNMAVFDITDGKVTGGGWAQFHKVARGLAVAALEAHLQREAAASKEPHA